MPGYSKLKVARLRQLCDERDIDCEGFTKTALVDALQQFDRRAEATDEGRSDGEEESDDGESEVQLGEHLFDQGGSPFDTADEAEQVLADTEEAESVTTLRLKLALRKEELKLKERELEIERERLAMRASTRENNIVTTSACDVREIKAFLPTMYNDDVLSFFMSYERVMTLNDVDESLWAKYLPSQLSPKALKTYTRLSLEDSRSYDKIKECILASFQLTAQTYHKMFRTMRRTGNCTYSLFLNNMREVLQRYCEANKATEFDAFFECILREQFLLALPTDVQAFVLSHQATCKTVEDLGKAADLSYQVKRINSERAEFKQNHAPGAAVYKPFDANGPLGRGSSQAMTAPRPPAGQTNWRGGSSGGGPSQYRGNNRGRPGYNMSMHRGRGGSFWASNRVKPDAKYDCDMLDARLCNDKHDGVTAQTFMYADKDYVVPLYVNGFSTHGIRDSGCNFVGLVAKHLVRAESINYQKLITLKGAFDGDKSHKVPTAVVKIRSPRFLYDQDIKVTMGVSDKLPQGVNCLLGNDLFRLHKELTDIISVRQNVTTSGSDTDREQQTQEQNKVDSTATDAQERDDSISVGDSRQTVHQVDRSDRKSTTGTQILITDTNSLTRQANNAAAVNGNSRNSENDVLTDTASGDAIDADSRDRPLIDTNGLTVSTAETAETCNKHPTLYALTRSGARRDRNQTLDTGHMFSSGHADVRDSSGNGDNGGDRRGSLTGADANATARPADEDTVKGDNGQALDGASAAGGRDHGAVSVNQPATDNAISDIPTDAAEAERSARETDINEVTKQLGGIDTTDLPARDNWQTHSEFAEAQRSDPALKHLWVRAEAGSSELAVINGILYRHVPSFIATSSYEFALVVPTQRQTEVIELAHGGKVGPHFGVRKTEQKIAAVFYFPKMRKKIRHYIKRCTKCQMIAPIKKKERQPLQKIEVTVKHAFEDLSIDILGGTLICTPRKNKYVLVTICNVTKFVHLTALTNLRADTIAEKLIEIFSFTGFPKIIRSDNMSSFKSELMEALRFKLGIEAKYSAPFHFMSHGSVERVNLSIENILRKLISEQREWDRMLPFIAFALREARHSTTGYSPAELVFGHQFRGLLHVVRETWIHGDPIPKYKKLSTARYIQQLRERIDNALQAANVHTDRAHQRMKAEYDKRSTVRELQAGDWTLLLLPTSGNKLLATWSGPHKVLRKCDQNGNYEILVDRRKAIYHINSLRKYYADDDDRDRLGLMIVADDSDETTPGDERETGIPPVVPQWAGRDAADFAIGKQLTPSQHEAMRCLLDEYPDVFASQPGRTHLISHHIQVTDDTPVYQPPYKIPDGMKDAVEAELKRMLDLNIIQYEDDSKWNSPLIIVKKRDQGIRLVNNFIALNKRTADEPYPMNDANELLSRVAGSKYVTKLDMISAYFQIPLTKESQKLTTFHAQPFGVFSYTCLPMGLKCAGFTCQRLLDRILRSLHRCTATLIDDILVFSKDFDTHLKNLREVLNRLRQAGLTLNTRKCTFASNDLKIFGHRVVSGKVYPDDDKIEVIKNWKTPQNKKQLRQHLGLINYFHAYIPQYSKIAFPLTEMLGKTKPDKLKWTEEAQKSFESLKQALISKPVLTPPDTTKEYLIMTDASQQALGCILMQPGDTEDSPCHVVAYASRKLLPRERNYATIEKEILAIVFALCKFHLFVYNRPVKIYSDHKPLQWLNTITKNSARLARWSLILQNYNVTTTYIKGERQLADVLTRMPE